MTAREEITIAYFLPFISNTMRPVKNTVIPEAIAGNNLMANSESPKNMRLNVNMKIDNGG